MVCLMSQEFFYYYLFSIKKEKNILLKIGEDMVHQLYLYK